MVNVPELAKAKEPVPLSSKYHQPYIERPLVDQCVKEAAPVKFECLIVHSASMVLLVLAYSNISNEATKLYK